MHTNVNDDVKIRKKLMSFGCFTKGRKLLANTVMRWTHGRSKYNELIRRGRCLSSKEAKLWTIVCDCAHLHRIFIITTDSWKSVKPFQGKCSDNNERKSEQAHIPHAPILQKCSIQRMAIQRISNGQSDREPVSSELHKIILVKIQKGYKLLLKKIN